MKTIYVIISIAALGLLAPLASAVIINIPDDYPTIQQGINASTGGDTVLVQPGIYVENINFNGHNIVLGSLFLTTGDSTYISETIIDGDSSGSVVTFESGEDSTAIITGFTIMNGFAYYGGGIFVIAGGPTIQANTVCRNVANCSSSEGGRGAGIYCGINSDPIIRHNYITENRAEFYHDDFNHRTGLGGGIYNNSFSIIADNVILGNYAIDPWIGSGYGGGIYCRGEFNSLILRNIIAGNHGGGINCGYRANPVIASNLIFDNWIEWDGGGIGIYGLASPTITNNIIYENSGTYNAGGIYCQSSSALMVNNICWNNYPRQIRMSGESIVSYCNIQDTLWPGEGNISIDPLFRDPENGDFHLMAIECSDPYDSPCIDAGDPSFEDILLDCSWGLGELRSDMGAYGGGDSVMVGIDFPDIRQPEKFSLSQNYPNPFNASTTIQYSLLEASQVKIEIYDILGRSVKTLVQEEQPAGYHQVVWDGKDKNDRMVSTGIYFYELYVDDYRESKAMIMIK